MHSTRSEVIEYLKTVTKKFSVRHINKHTAKNIAEELSISRSLASQYLNDLHKEGLVIKINTRPVYFLDKTILERSLGIEFKKEYDSLNQFIDNYNKKSSRSILEGVIGYEDSLSEAINQIMVSLTYPQNGLPIVVYGDEGVGKKHLISSVITSCMYDGTLHSDSSILEIIVDNSDVDQDLECFFEKINDFKKEKTMLPILILRESDKLTKTQQFTLVRLLNKINELDSSTNFRIIFISRKKPSDYMVPELLSKVPIITYIPSIHERYIEEREKLVVEFFLEEEKRLNKNIYISSVTFRTLVNTAFEDNISGLENTIKWICASAVQSSNNDKLLIGALNLPENLLSTINIDEELENQPMEIRKYERSNEVEIIINYFDQILDVFNKSQMNDQELKCCIEECSVIVRDFSEYLIYKRKYSVNLVKAIEISVTKIFDTVLKKQNANIPVNFAFVISRLLYLFEQFDSSLTKWLKQNSSKSQQVASQLRNKFTHESYIVDEVLLLLNSNLNIETPVIIEIIMLITINHYNHQLSDRNVLGLIICHGYSTASSIADAVNNMLDDYVFEAIDMPLDTSVEDVIDELAHHQKRLNRNCDVVMMVDMGSLEQLGYLIEKNSIGNVGVINSVSTKLALDVGSKIIQNIPIAKVLSEVCKTSKAKYTYIEGRGTDTIIFVSDSGIHMAKKMRNLFKNSFPSTVNINFIATEYSTLLNEGSEHHLFTKNNVIFITGTINPNIDGYEFIPLEQIIVSNDMSYMRNLLAGHLENEELELTIKELRKNFSLENVVEFLTILNPTALLDRVTDSVDILQSNLGVTFGGNTLVGIYVHISCLVERLVTKTAITTYKDLDEFEEKQKRFIQIVNTSFKQIIEHYNVELPISEIAYLYEFIESDGEGRDLMDNWKDIEGDL